MSPPVVVGSLPARPGQVRVRVEEEDEVVRAGTSTATAAGAASTATAAGAASTATAAGAASTATAAGAGAEGAAGAVEAEGGEGAAGAAGAGRRGREDPFLILVREDILYQRQADERREVESRVRFERFFSLIERLVERRE